MQAWDAESGPPRPRYVIGVELTSGRVLRIADADSLVWAQAHFIQIVASMRAAGGGGALVLVHVATNQVRQRQTVTPGEPSND